MEYHKIKKEQDNTIYSEVASHCWSLEQSMDIYIYIEYIVKVVGTNMYTKVNKSRFS